ncbi:hypothetical protein WN48_05339 [Eufriesea mexicana]|nr:hypothetical protein WN48_05339 [Eufriesea mexicana]
MRAKHEVGNLLLNGNIKRKLIPLGRKYHKWTVAGNGYIEKLPGYYFHDGVESKNRGNCIVSPVQDNQSLSKGFVLC